MKLFLSLSFIAATFVVYGQTDEQREVIKASMNSEIVQKTNNQVSVLSLEREKKVAAYLKNNPEKKKSFTKEGKEYFLYNISKDGLPIYINTKDLPQVSNTKASTLYSGGSIGVAITGTNMVAGVWDGGQVNASHISLVGQSSMQPNQVISSDIGNAHQQAVTGIMVGKNINNAQGIAYNATTRNYDWDSDLTEMNAFANDAFLISNHSYGYSNDNTIAPWNFGAYDEQSKAWDVMLKSKPFYLPFVAGGNEQQTSGNSSANGFDIMTGSSASKNVITVGAINSDNSMSDYSNWGPTDDGRIKPDLVTLGTSIDVPLYIGNTSYTGNVISSSGTSYATPSAAAGALLLQQYYYSLNNTYMKAAMLKSLLLHSTDDDSSGNGPDAKFGWGILNLEKAANIIKQNSTTNGTAKMLMITTNPANDATAEVVTNYTFGPNGARASLCWVDDEGVEQVSGNGVNNTTSRMAYNFSMKLEQVTPALTAFPYNNLSVTSPSTPAVVGTNWFQSANNYIQANLATTTDNASGIVSIRKSATSPSATREMALIITGLKSNSLVSQNFTISNGAFMVTDGAVTIDFGGGTLTNNGTIINTDGTLSFSGPVTFDGSGTTNTNNLTVSHSGTSMLSNRITITGALTVSNGTLNANNNLALVSNAAGSAVIAPVAAGSSITGKVTVQRYIAQGKRAFRFLTPSVTTDNFISGNWQLGTHITGSTTGANGFDTTVSGSPSLFTYNNQQATGSGWAAIGNTNATNLNAMQGYRLLIRGDRTGTLITQASLADMNVPVTLSATGTVTTGQVTFNSSSTPTSINNTSNGTTDGYSLIGNPYVNTINWNLLTKSGLEAAYYTWDSNMGTPDQRGRYVAYHSTSGTNTSSSSVNQYIQPGQAFFVKNTTLGTAGSITFNESDKLGTNITNFYRTTTTDFSRLELQVYQTSELALGAYPIDAAVSVFDNQFTNAIENGDVTKLSTGIENISFLNSNLALTIDARPQVVATDELQVQLQQFQANKNYTFRTHFNNFDPATTPFLVDTYLNQYTALANTATTDFVFTTTTDALSYSTNRFKIVFQNNALNNPNFSAENIVVYPNPVTNNQFNIALPSYITGEVAIKIINTIGQTVYETKTEAQNTITITPKKSLSQGLYFVELTNQGTTCIKKITIQ